MISTIPLFQTKWETEFRAFEAELTRIAADYKPKEPLTDREKRDEVQSVILPAITTEELLHACQEKLLEEQKELNKLLGTKTFCDATYTYQNKVLSTLVHFIAWARQLKAECLESV